MFSSPFAYAWIAWLLVIGVIGILRFAAHQREKRIAAPLADLRSLFAQAPARILPEHANTARQTALTAPPAELRTLFGQVATRTILQYANTSRQVALAYPKALIGDTVAPQINNVRTRSVAGGVKITWTTDEFATSEVRWGIASGVYTQTASDPLFEKNHSLTLTGLTAGRTYYFVVRGADRSGNQVQSGEYQVKVQTKSYLPLIRRQWRLRTTNRSERHETTDSPHHRLGRVARCIPCAQWLWRQTS